MASIEKRGDSYRITVFAGRDENGRQVKEYATIRPTAKTPKAIEKEVQAFALDFEKRVKEGDIYDEKTKFSDVWKMYKENVLSQKSLRTQQDYTGYIERRFLPAIGHLPIGKIRAAHIDKILHAMSEEGKAPKTIRNHYVACNVVFGYAYKKGIIRENPCSRCDTLPSVVRDGELHYWDVSQAKTFLHALELEYPTEKQAVTRHLDSGDYHIDGYTAKHRIPFQWRAYFSLAIYGGFRRGEIVALTWKDVNFENHTVNINKSATYSPATGQITKSPKTKSGVREIVLPAETFRILSNWKKKQSELSMRLGTAWKGFRGKDFDDNSIFIDLTDGTQMCLDTPTHKFGEIVKLYNSTYAQTEEEKLPEIRLHDLRHTSATLLLGNGTDIETVSKRLGHSKASITLDVYAHALPEKDRTASDILENLFA